MLVKILWFFRTPNQLPSISFTGKRKSSNTKGKKPKVTTYDRDIVCLPFSYSSSDGQYAIPRKESRANLASNGLIGKICLASDMEEDEILSEIRSVFANAVGHDPAFPFSLLQRCGPGTNALTAPSLSSSFSWTAREIGWLGLYLRESRSWIDFTTSWSTCKHYGLYGFMWCIYTCMLAMCTHTFMMWVCILVDGKQCTNTIFCTVLLWLVGMAAGL